MPLGSQQLIPTWWKGNFSSQTPAEAWGSLKALNYRLRGFLGQSFLHQLGGNSACCTLQRLTLCFLTCRSLLLPCVPSSLDFELTTKGRTTSRLAFHSPGFQISSRGALLCPRMNEPAPPLPLPLPLRQAKTSPKQPVPFGHPGPGNPGLSFFPDAPLCNKLLLKHKAPSHRRGASEVAKMKIT